MGGWRNKVSKVGIIIWNKIYAAPNCANQKRKYITPKPNFNNFFSNIRNSQNANRNNQKGKLSNNFIEPKADIISPNKPYNMKKEKTKQNNKKSLLSFNPFPFFFPRANKNKSYQKHNNTQIDKEYWKAYSCNAN